MQTQQHRRLTVGLILAVWIGCPVCGHGGQEPDRVSVSQIIANVRANESLFLHLEVLARADYRYHGPTEGALPGLSREYMEQRRTVLQGQLLYVSEISSGRTIEGAGERTSEVSGYDGTVTRLVSMNLANIHHGRHESSHIVRPHTLLFRGNISTPLSVWLQGGDLFRNHPAAGSFKDADRRVHFEKEEIINGVRCFKVRVETWMPEDGESYLNTKWYIWLAPEKNYLPVKFTGFIHPDLDFLVEEGIVSDFREVKPGLWFPFAQAVTVYDPATSTRDSKVADVVEKLTIEKVDFNPNYPLAFFRDIPIPKGILVYEIQDGEIIKSYIQGQLRDNKSRMSKQQLAESQGVSVRRFVAILVLLVVVLLLIYAYRDKIGALWNSRTPKA